MTSAFEHGPRSPVSSLALILLALFGACGNDSELREPPEPPDASMDAPVPTDFDGDGHSADADCNDADAKLWQVLPYAHRDTDGDHRAVPSIGTVCSGLQLPDGYFATSPGTDCDDTDASRYEQLTGYVDADGDAVGDGEMRTFCTGGALPTGYAAAAGDCAPTDVAAWTPRSYAFRDADGDGAAVASVGTVCSGVALPPGYLLLAPPNRPLDCDDGDAGSFVELAGFLDVDGDQFGDGPALSFCTAGVLPAGHAPSAGDCAPTNSAAWMMRAYEYRDADGDGAAVPSSGQVCSGAALPPGYLLQPPARPNDCDDRNPQVFETLMVFRDGDGDGFGAGTSRYTCTNGTAPPGTSIFGSDCDDTSASRWMSLFYVAIDRDGDGATVPESGTRCTAGFLTPPYYAAAIGHDCDDDDPQVTRLVALYPDADGDGVGTSPRQLQCLGAAIPAGLSARGYDEDDADPRVIETEDFEEELAVVLD